MSSNQQQKQNPSKLFYRIGEVSRITGLAPYVLRYWETEFSVLRPEKKRSGQRIYSDKDLENILLIKRLLYEDGYTIAGAKKRLDSGAGQAADVFSAIKKELEEVLEILK